MNNDLENYRKEIDKIDFEIIDLLAKRMSIVDRIAEYKKENEIAIIDEKRFSEIIDTRLEMAEKLNTDQNLVESIFQLIHDSSVKRQKR
ncbi:MAG: chorismate mutase [Patescibacteria group bacterium]